MITPGGAAVLRAMIVSCGSVGCLTSIDLLGKVTKPVTLASLGLDDDGHWRMAAFSRLKDFAVDAGIESLDTFDVARYFGGNTHIEIFRRLPEAGLGKFLGPYAGLVTHVLLPLSADGTYQNGKMKVSFSGDIPTYSPSAKGVSCYHLGTISRIPLTEAEIAAVKAEQAASEPFVTAVAKIKGPIVLPENYLTALTCTVNKAA